MEKDVKSRAQMAEQAQRDIAIIFADLAARQEPLGAEFEAAWSENVEELYES